MKTIFFVLALLAVALAAPADDNNDKKSEKVRDYDANLKFNWRGDGSWKSQIDAAFKPVADFLNMLGLKGNLNSGTNGTGGGDITGHFRLSGKRGNGPRSNDAGDDAGNDANSNPSPSAPSSATKPGRMGISSLVEAGQGAVNGISIPQLPSLPNIPGARSGRSALPQLG